MPWTSDAIPDQRGKTFVVTGANSGIGLEATAILAKKGAHVVLACRSPSRAKDALETIGKRASGSSVEVMSLDLSSLESVRGFAAELAAKHPKIDGLVNNAGLMALPYGKTKDGFEMQLGTNHLGHFALTGLLLPQLLATKGSRVVNVASTAHRWGRMRWDDLMGERGYDAWGWYGQSKLANLLFTYELARRLEQKGLGTTALACHPGYAATALQHKGPEMEGSRFKAMFMTVGNTILAQGPEMGALPTLRALCDPDAKNAEYYGPRGPFEMAGYPVKVGSTKPSHDRESQRRLWDESEKLTGVRFEGLA